jgi:hypothetical protein
MGVVNSISFFLLLLVKITITLVIGLIIFSIICSNPSFLSSTPVTSPMAPVLVSCVLAWLIASAFANVYDACIDTILISFCEDTEMNGEGSSDYMSEELCRIMGGNDEVKRKVIKVSSAPSSTRLESTSPPTLSSPGTNSKIAIDAKRPFQVVQEDNSII